MGKIWEQIFTYNTEKREKFYWNKQKFPNKNTSNGMNTLEPKCAKINVRGSRSVESEWVIKSNFYSSKNSSVFDIG